MLMFMVDDWHPSSLFRPGDAGGFWDFHPQYCAQNSDGTGAAAVGQPVGWVRDLSGNGNHMIQSTTSKKPVLRQDVGGWFYVEHDGVDDDMQTVAAMAASITDCSVHIAIADRDDINQNPFSLTADLTPNRCNVHTNEGGYIEGDFGEHADGSRIKVPRTIPSDQTYILSYIASGTLHYIRVNGAQIGQKTRIVTSVTPAAGILLGIFPGGWGRTDGRIYAFFAISRALSAAETALIERWLARRAGVVL